MTRPAPLVAVVAALAGCTLSVPPGPTLESIAPDRAPAGSAAALTVRGSGFRALVQVDFDAPASSTVRTDFVLALVSGGARVPLEGVVVVSDRELSATLPAASAVGGRYALSLVDPRGRSAVLEAAFVAYAPGCVEDGIPCDDGDACTEGETCVAGACGAPASTVACTALDACHLPGTCDPASGVCSDPPAPDGTTCDDGDACTAGDACEAGSCAPGALACANTAPVACLAVTPLSGVAGATVFTLDPSCSFDADEAVSSLKARLDVDGDGTWETGWAPADEALAHVFAAPGLPVATVEVRDSEGLSAFASRHAVVLAASDPVVAVTTAVDEDDPGATPAAPGGTGLSLREAIQWVNGLGTTAGTIQLAAAAPIVHRTPLPPLTVAGSRIVGGPGATLAFDNVNQACLTLDAPGQLVLGVAITGCANVALAMSPRSAGSQVAECTIGPAASSPRPTAIGVTGQATGLIGPRNEITGVGTAVKLTGSGYVVDGNHIHGNELGVQVAGVSATIRRNVIHANASRGVSASISLSASCTVLHNVFDANGGDGVSVANLGGGLVARNNLFTGNGGWGIDNGSSLATLEHNGFFANVEGAMSSPAPGPSDVLADPRYTAGHRLSPTSPAIDRGIDTGLDVNGPAAGHYEGSAPDLGAAEAPYPAP